MSERELAMLHVDEVIRELTRVADGERPSSSLRELLHFAALRFGPSGDWPLPAGSRAP